MSKESPKVARQTGVQQFSHQEQEQEGGRTMAPPAFQLHADPAAPPANPVPQRKQPNETGMPDQLKAGIEQLSGHDMSDVRVHYNSDQPADLQAQAFAQGSEIHLAPGQEQHLPHEAWHVAQQKQGRVQATTQLKGIGINDDSSLEREADVMGAKAAQLKATAQDKPLVQRQLNAGAVQRMVVQIVPEMQKKEKQKEIKEEKKEQKKPLFNFGEEINWNPNKVDEFSLDIFDKKNDFSLFQDKDIMVEDDFFNPYEKKEEKEDKKKLPKNSNQPFIYEINDTGFDLCPSEGLFEYPPLAFGDLEFTIPKEMQEDLPPLRIGKVHIIGRPKSLFSKSMGDHTTAFGIHAAGLKIGLKGKTVFEAVEYLWSLLGMAQDLPGYKECKKEGKEQEKFQQAEKNLVMGLENLAFHASFCKFDQGRQAKAFLTMQDVIEYYLEFRELIPLSAINVAAKSPALAGKGKGEFKYIQQLQKWEEGDTPPGKYELLEAVEGTFDPHAVAMTLIESQGDLLKEMAPGLAPQQGLLDQIILFVKNHFHSLKMAFPQVGGLIEENANEYGKIIEHEICQIVVERAFEESLYAQDRLNSLGEQRTRLNESREMDEFEVGNLDKEWIDDPKHNVKKVTESNFIVKEDTQKKSTTKKRKLTVPQITLTEYYKREFTSIKNATEEQQKICGARVNTIVEAEKLLGNGDENLREKLVEKIQNSSEEEQKGDLEMQTTKLNEKEQDVLFEEDRSQSLGTMIKYDFGNSIMEIKFAGRPKSPFKSGGMGAHTTAWLVYQDWISSQLKRKDLDGAIKTLVGPMFGKMDVRESNILLSLDKDADIGYDLSELVIAKQRFLDYAMLMQEQSPSAKKLMLQQLINHFLSYINMIPGTTTAKGDTSGHGEAKHRKELKEDAQNGIKPRKKNINGLLDVSDLPDAYSGYETQKLLRDGHTELVNEAYPSEVFSFSPNTLSLFGIKN